MPLIPVGGRGRQISEFSHSGLQREFPDSQGYTEKLVSGKKKKIISVLLSSDCHCFSLDHSDVCAVGTDLQQPTAALCSASLRRIRAVHLEPRKW